MVLAGGVTVAAAHATAAPAPLFTVNVIVKLRGVILASGSTVSELDTVTIAVYVPVRSPVTGITEKLLAAFRVAIDGIVTDSPGAPYVPVPTLNVKLSALKPDNDIFSSPVGCEPRLVTLAVYAAGAMLNALAGNVYVAGTAGLPVAVVLSETSYKGGAVGIAALRRAAPALQLPLAAVLAQM